MWIKDTFETFSDYKKISFYIFGTTCKLNCANCFHDHTKSYANKNVTNEDITEYILSNKLIESALFSGLNWLDQLEDLISFIQYFRTKSNKDIVIYTGYTEEECAYQIEKLSIYNNIIVKFGRFIPNTDKVFDEVLGVTLASNNQYAKKIS